MAIRKRLLESPAAVTENQPQVIVIKLGGSVLKDPETLNSLCQDLVKLQDGGFSPVVVHGGGPAINEELTARGITWEFYQGLRITTKPMMDVIEMVLSGKINRQLVRAIQSSGGKAVGISGVDGNLLHCIPAHTLLGQVGKIERVDSQLIHQLITPPSSHSRGIIPVIAPIGIDASGNSYNINADWAASKIAQALDVKNLIYITDQNGILTPQGDTLSSLDDQNLQDLIDQEVVKGGMLAKVRTILDALAEKPPVRLHSTRSRPPQSRVQKVHILNARQPQAILDAALHCSPTGTVCQLRDQTQHYPSRN